MTENSILTGGSDSKPFWKCYDDLCDNVFKYSLKLCNDPLLAEEITAITFVNVFGMFARGFEPDRNLEGYIFQAAHNWFVKEVRRNSRLKPLEVLEGISCADGVPGEINPFPDPAATAENNDLMRGVYRVLEGEVGHLTVMQRKVLISRFLEGLSLKETAKALGISVGDVKATQHRALAEIRRALGPSFFE